MKLRIFIGLLLLNASTYSAPLESINTEYRNKIKPILKNNCLSCHGDTTLSPWYRDLPGVNIYINGHISDAKKSLNMEDDIPFKGKGIQSDIFWSIITSIRDERMPPKSFSILHQDIKFDKEEKEILIKWFSDKRRELIQHDL